MMMANNWTGFIQLLTALSSFVISLGSKCTETPLHGHLAFTKNLTSRAYVRNGQAVTLECCAEGYDILEWSFLRTHTSTWKKFPFYYTCPCDTSLERLGKNQTLRLLRAGDGDKGIYSCLARNLTTKQDIHHNTSLDVYECTDRGKPLPLCPSPTDVYAAEGDNVTFVCGGDFGCKDRGLRSVDWYINGNDVADVHNGRYAQLSSTKSGGTVIYEKLTIANIQNVDFNVNFTCWITSDYDQGNYQCAVVHIKRLPQGWSLQTLLLVSVIPGVFVLTTIVLSVVVHVNCGPQIRLYVKSRVPWSVFIEKGNKRYHTFICHGEEDQDELNAVDSIRRELKKRGYHVAGMREDDVLGGQCRLEAAGGLLENSASVICMGGDIPVEKKHMIQTIKSTVPPKRIIVVLIPGRDNKYIRHEELKSLFAVKWPGPKSSLWKMKKFYCSLRLRLPRVEKLKLLLERIEDADERRELLNTPSTASTTNGQNFSFCENGLNQSELNRNDHSYGSFEDCDEDNSQNEIDERSLSFTKCERSKSACEDTQQRGISSMPTSIVCHRLKDGEDNHGNEDVRRDTEVCYTCTSGVRHPSAGKYEGDRMNSSGFYYEQEDTRMADSCVNKDKREAQTADQVDRSSLPNLTNETMGVGVTIKRIPPVIRDASTESGYDSHSPPFSL